jgi:hypothetical protein
MYKVDSVSPHPMKLKKTVIKNVIVNTFVCYRQVNMAVGFGAIRRSVSEDLIVSSYHLIRKYTVKLIILHPRSV